jgi:molecular chaperone GrpE
MNPDEEIYTQEALDESSQGMSEEELESIESKEGAKLTKIKKELDACKIEKQEYLDGWQRAKADYVNALKRFEEEKKGLVELGVLKAARNFLTVADSLVRAQKVGDVPESFMGIQKQLDEAIRSLGLSQYGEIGEMFDPMLHEALGQDSVTEKEKEDTITAILEQGWRSTTGVVRAAKVRVGALG